MSKTHIILINLKLEHLNKENEIVRYAENRTADYQYIAFDYRTVGDLILGSNNPDKILELVEQCRDTQQQQINHHLNYLNKRLGDSLSQIVSTLSNERDYSLSNPLKDLADLLDGKYTFESGFFDTQYSTSRIDADTLQAIRKAPEDFALVLFNCHYEGGYLTKYHREIVTRPSYTSFLVCHNNTLTQNQEKLLENFVKENLPNKSLDEVIYSIYYELRKGNSITDEKQLRKIFEQFYPLSECEVVVSEYNSYLKRLQAGKSLTKVCIDLFNQLMPADLFRDLCNILKSDDDFDFIGEEF